MGKICLLIIDIQAALIDEQPVDEDKMINNIQKLIKVSQKCQVEVIYVRHHDNELIYNTSGWQIDSRIIPRKEDKIFDKQYNSAFKDTTLDSYLKKQEIECLIIVGMQSEYCIDTTIKVAFELGYQVIVPKNATTTFDNEYFTGKKLKQYFETKIWNKRFAQVMEVDEVIAMIEDKLKCKFIFGKANFADSKLIREKVFVEEQGFELEFDEIDNVAHHLVIYQNSSPIAVGRMYPKNEKVMIFGRIATLKEYRGQNIGSKIVKELENKAYELGYYEVELSAQQRAQGFYEKLGYKIDGELYYDEWCPHVTMKKLL